MKDVKITATCFVPKANVKYYVSYDGSSVINRIRHMKAEDRVLDLTKGKKTNTVIMLNDGTAILVNTGLKVINERMEDDSQ